MSDYVDPYRIPDWQIDRPFVDIVIPTLDVDKARVTANLAIKRSIDVPGRAVIILDRKREGYTRTVNRALENCGSGDVCILVDDCEPCEGWLYALQQALYERSSLKVWFAGPSGPCRTAPQNGGRQGDLRCPRIVSHLAGFCLYVRRDCLKQLGGLDEAFIHYASDVDWQRRATRDFGAKSLWVPSVYVDHTLHPPHMEWWGKDQEMLHSLWR